MGREIVKPKSTKRPAKPAKTSKGDGAEAGAGAEKHVWRDRIVSSAKVDPKKLIAHDKNWRTHPAAQSKTLGAAIGRIGFIRSVTVNRRTGRILDGHLRVALAIQSGQPAIRVEYVDLDEREEAEALQTIDPIAAMAQADAELLEELQTFAPLEGDNFADLRAKLDEYLAESEIADEGESAGSGDGSGGGGGNSGGGGDQFIVIIRCVDEEHQSQLLDAIDHGPADRLFAEVKREGIDIKAPIS